ncbi:MAG: GIY-YIG nuclease family protein [Burkholderiales bacterium]|nr:GIY-YIG nuclease family protein [Anaerolineae bacterium]
MNPKSERFYRIVERNNETLIVDLDGNVIDPHKMEQLASSIITTKRQPLYVYIGGREHDKLYKIGMTRNIERRSKQLGIKVIQTIQCDRFGTYSAANVEKQLHAIMNALGCHVEGEWFQLDSFDIQFLAQFRTPKDVVDNAQQVIELAEKLWHDGSVLDVDLLSELVYRTSHLSRFERVVLWHYFIVLCDKLAHTENIDGLPISVLIYNLFMTATGLHPKPTKSLRETLTDLYGNSLPVV